MQQLRIHKRNRWGAVPEALAEDLRLSLAARAVAVWLMIKPDGWIINIGAMLSRVGCSKDLWQRRIAPELVAAGYLARQRTHAPSGKIRWVHEFSPDGALQATITRKSSTGFSVAGSSVNGESNHIDIPLQIDHIDTPPPHAPASAPTVVVEEIDELVNAAVWAAPQGGKKISNLPGFRAAVRKRILTSGASVEDALALKAWRASQQPRTVPQLDQKNKIWSSIRLLWQKAQNTFLSPVSESVSKLSKRQMGSGHENGAFMKIPTSKPSATPLPP